MEKSWWRSPVYLMTGLKIARGMSAESENKSGYGGAVKLGIDATMASGGIPVSVGPMLEGKVEKMEGVSWAGSQDFIFGYCLVRIKLRGKKGDFKEGDYNKGALYDDDNANADERRIK